MSLLPSRQSCLIGTFSSRCCEHRVCNKKKINFLTRSCKADVAISFAVCAITHNTQHSTLTIHLLTNLEGKLGKRSKFRRMSIHTFNILSSSF